MKTLMCLLICCLVSCEEVNTSKHKAQKQTWDVVFYSGNTSMRRWENIDNKPITGSTYTFFKDEYGKEIYISGSFIITEN